MTVEKFLSRMSFRFLTPRRFWYFLIVAWVTFPTAAWALSERAADLRQQGLDAQRDGRVEDAIALFERAQQEDPQVSTFYNDAGVCHEQNGDAKSAERMYRKALQLDPDFAQAHTNLALLYESQGKQDQALAHWEKRAELGPADSVWALRAVEKVMVAGRPKSRPATAVNFQVKKKAVPSEGTSLKAKGPVAKKNMFARLKEHLFPKWPHEMENQERPQARSTQTTAAFEATPEELINKGELSKGRLATRTAPGPVPAAPAAAVKTEARSPKMEVQKVSVSSGPEPSVPDLKKAREWVQRQLAASQKQETKPSQ